MGKGHTIALNLYDEHIEVLDRLAKRQGSRSGAVQRLLEEAKRQETYRELDEAYREYLKSGDEEAEQDLTGQMFQAASWPEDWLEGEKGGRKRARSRKRKAR